jgi:iron complex outermembrane receptor protein
VTVSRTSKRNCVSLFALAIAIPSTVHAQSSAERPADEIIVTARLKQESIQSVPIAITALTAEDMAKRNISNLNDLTNTTPGISITSIAGGTMQMVYIRGQAPANTTNDLNVEANVGVFIDGIYQTSRNTIDIISVLDVGGIEVARGPQSALFGRSTFAGALSINTRTPADHLEGNIQATVGADEDYRIRGSLSAPITDTLSARIGGGYLTYDGYGTNAANRDDNLGGTEKYAITGSLEFRPSSEFTALLSGFVTHSSTELSPSSVLPISIFNCGAVNAATGVRTRYCGPIQTPETSDLTPNAPDTVAKSRQVSLKLNWRHQGVSATSITAFTAAENRTYNDYDGTSLGARVGICSAGVACFPAGAYNRAININLLTSSRERVRTFSQEIRLQSDNDSPFQWIAGGSYFNSRIPLAALGLGADGSQLAPNERLVQMAPPINPAASGVGSYDFSTNPFLTNDWLNNQVFASYSRASTRTMSIFGSLSYQLGDLRIGAEGRYNIDRKRAQVLSASNPLSQPGFNKPISGTTVPTTGTFPVVGPQFARTFDSFTPRITLDYQATPDIFFYATAAKGVRSGGFNTGNPVSATGILAEEVTYEEETNWTYEAGVKSQLFDRRLTLNASYFHIDWKNAQITAFTNNPTSVGANAIVRNAGNLKTNGFELLGDFRLFDPLSIGGSLVYSDPKFQKGAYDSATTCLVGAGAAATAALGCPPVIVVATPSGQRAATSLEGNRPSRSVKLQWNIHAALDLPLNDQWSLSGRVDVSHSGTVYSDATNLATFGKRTLTNVRLGVENDRYSIALWVNNLFDVAYTANAISQPRAGIPFAFFPFETYLGETRRMGVTAGFKF